MALEQSGFGHALEGEAPIVPRPLLAPKGWWVRLAGPIASALILAAVAYQLRTIDVRRLIGLVPASPAFWLCFAAHYLIGPVSEWLIFRRLWKLPPSGLGALLRKLVSNELLLGYSGELYFYAWARRRARLVAAPFGAVKDVAILSALVGNVFCLVLIAFAWPLLGALHAGPDPRQVTASACVVLLSSAAMALFRRRLFTLPRGELIGICVVHSVRTVGKSALAALMWHLLLPQVALGWWLVLAAARQLLSRLPLLPNKDVAFAGIVVVLVGGTGDIAAAMTLVASLILLTHLVIGASLAAAELAAEGGR